MSATKKTIKIETPIDDRETFVSLQKNFADSEISVQEKLNVLYGLQKADNELEKIFQLRGELPAEVSALEAEVDSYKAKADGFRDMIAAEEQAIKDHVGEMEELDGEIAKYQEQLANISNSREYDSINKELENLDLLRKIADKNIGEAKVRIEAHKAAIDELLERTEICSADLAAKKVELETISKDTADVEAALQASRDGLAAKLDARTLSAYDRIRSSVHNRLAVVPIYNGDSCGGCFNTITPQRILDIRSGNKLVICEHCGRIIVAPSEAESKN
ncbi:MAG: C4-type zinc ribbon domain-containing protein [Bacteroidales bacterium]|nr:C4-type zinc ribbon domain-containing protein [Bacteroidales bacterium]